MSYPSRTIRGMEENESDSGGRTAVGLPPDGEFVSVTFDGLDLAEAVIGDREFDECVFRRCSLRYAKLTDCTVTDTTFEDCELSLVDLTDTRFVDCVFVDCKLAGVDWTRVRFSRLGTSMTFRGCTLENSVLGGLDLRRWSFVDCVLRHVDFAESCLTDCDFAGSDLGGATFNQTDLKRAQLQSAFDYRIDPMINDVRGAYFSLPEAGALLRPFDISLVEPTFQPGHVSRP